MSYPDNSDPENGSSFEASNSIPTYPELKDYRTDSQRLEEIKKDLEAKAQEMIPVRISAEELDKDKRFGLINFDYLLLGVKTVSRSLKNKARSLYTSFRNATGYDEAKLSGYNPFYLDDDKKLRGVRINTNTLGYYDIEKDYVAVSSRHSRPTIADEVTNAAAKGARTPTISTTAHEMVHKVHWVALGKIDFLKVFSPTFFTSVLYSMNSLAEIQGSNSTVHPLANLAAMGAGVLYAIAARRYILKERNSVVYDTQIGLYDELLAQVTSNFYYDGIKCDDRFFKRFDSRGGYKQLVEGSDAQENFKKVYQRIYILASVGYPLKQLNADFENVALTLRDMNNKEANTYIKSYISSKLLSQIKAGKLLDSEQIKQFEAELEGDDLFNPGDISWGDRKTPICDELLKRANLRSEINAKYLKMLSYKEFGKDLNTALADKSRNALFCPTRDISRSSRTDSVYFLTDTQERKLLKGRTLAPNERIAFRANVQRFKRGFFSESYGNIGIVIIDTDTMSEKIVEEGLILASLEPQAAQEILQEYLKTLRTKERNLVLKELKAQPQRQNSEIDRKVRLAQKQESRGRSRRGSSGSIRHRPAAQTRREIIRNLQAKQITARNYFGDIAKKEALKAMRPSALRR